MNFFAGKKNVSLFRPYSEIMHVIILRLVLVTQRVQAHSVKRISARSTVLGYYISKQNLTKSVLHTRRSHSLGNTVPSNIMRKNKGPEGPNILQLAPSTISSIKLQSVHKHKIKIRYRKNILRRPFFCKNKAIKYVALISELEIKNKLFFISPV